MSIDSTEKAGLHKGYQHWCQEVEPNEDWDKDLNFVLIRSISELRELDVEHRFVAWDTETTGLNPDIDWLVGVSFSFDGVTGYYVPIKHDDIALGKEALDIFYSILKKAKVQFLYNCRFDQRFLEAAGYSLEGLPYYDVMNAIWLADTNVVMPSLKRSERSFLGWVPKTFSETLGEATTFQHVPAEDAYKYACLAEHERIMMADHSTKRICEVETGDMVRTPQGVRKVIAVYNNGIRPCYRLVWNGGIVTLATGNHQFLFFNPETGEEAWKSVEEIYNLSCSERKFLLDAVRITPTGKHNKLQLVSVSTFRPCVVYDIQVEEEHCFVLANGVVSHNCTDALGTYNLGLISNKFYKESYPASKYDNDSLYPMMRMENTPQRLDLEYLRSLRGEVNAREEEILKRVYQLAGCTFNVNSPAQFGKVLIEHFGVDTGQRTSTGAMKADLKTLNAWMTKMGSRIGEELHEFLEAYQEYKKIVKFKSSYLEKYIKAAAESDVFPIRFSYKFQSVPCLTENNVVLTKDRGFVSIKDVKENDVIWTAWGYKRVLWNNTHEVKDFYRVILENGMTLEGTGHHPVLVRKTPLEQISLNGMTKDDVEWAGIQDLRQGEPVILNHTPSSLSCEESWKRDLARIMGYFFGKGKLTDSVLMCLCFDDISLSLFYRDLMIRVFGKKSVHRYDLDKTRVEYSVTLHTLSRLLSDKGIPPIEKDKVRTVSVYAKIADELSRHTETFRHFLAGYLDSKKTSLKDLGYKEIPENWYDGVSEDRVVFVIPTSEKDSILPMLWAQAISCSVSDHKFKAWFGEGKVTRIEITDPYALSNLLSLWNSGDAGLCRFSLVKVPKKFRMYGESSVVNVEHVEESTTVYDIEVEDVHEYVANGIITHNTGRISCGGDSKNTYFTQNNVQCLEENTTVLTSKGIKSISQVETGDLIWTGKVFAPCQQLGSKIRKVIRIVTVCGDVVCSREHLVLMSDIHHDSGVFIQAGALEVGQFLKYAGDGDKVFSDVDSEGYFPAKIERIEDAGEAVCYDLFVPEYERFTANGFIVHNSTPKPHSMMVKGRRATEKEIQDKQDILGWYFSNDIPDDEAVGLVEGMDPHMNIRRAFLPENDDCYVVSIDMAGEEIRIVANIYNEKTWVDAFNSGADVHKSTALKLFGPENYSKEARKKSKVASFGMLYGSGAQGFNQSFPDMTLEECRQFLAKFREALPSITQGQAESVAYAREHGTINTGFGRQRRVRSYFQSGDRAKIAFAERTTKNCYSPDTEFLTKDGWKLAVDITPTTQLAYYDPDDGTLAYCDAGERYTNVCTESIHFKSRNAAWNVTTNHRMWVRSTSHDKWRPCEAEKLESLSVWQEVCSAELHSGYEEDSKMETPLGYFTRLELARLFAWVLTDSSFTEKEHYLICTQNKEANFTLIEEVFRPFGAKSKVRPCSITLSGKELVEYISNREFCTWVLSQIGGRLKSERRVPRWLFRATKSVREEFLKHLVLGDGSRHEYSKKGGCSFYSANRGLIDDVQVLFTMTGYRCGMHTYINATGTEVYRLTCLKVSVRNMDNRVRKDGTRQLVRVKHEPLEYSCFSVPTQILVTRYKGKVTFGMNTVVQGTAADVLKLIICRLWTNVFKPYPQVKFMSTIHDEVNFSIPRELAREVIPICIKCMTIEREDWPIVLECSLSLGRVSLGDLIPFKYNAETKEFVPEWEKSEEVLKKRTGHADESSNMETSDADQEDPYFGLPPEACEF